MKRTRMYRKDDLMTTIICDDYTMLLVLKRFGMTLGLVDKTVGMYCYEYSVNLETFLAVVNLMVRSEERAYFPSVTKIDIHDLMKYLRNSHNQFVNLRLPELRAKLEDALGEGLFQTLAMNYFDDYTRELDAHLKFEEETVFPYVESLVAKNYEGKFRINDYISNHENVEAPLSDFKNLIIKYLVIEKDEVIDVLHDILSCTNDLSRHSLVEEKLLIPYVLKMEKKIWQ